MATDAGAGVHLSTRVAIRQWQAPIDRGDIAVSQIRAAIDRATVVGAMAVLTEPRHALRQQGRIIRTVRGMAVAAIVGRRTVFPQERTPFFGMTHVASLVNGILDQQTGTG